MKLVAQTEQLDDVSLATQARARGAAIAPAASTIARTSAGNAGTPLQSPGAAPASPARRAGPAVVPVPVPAASTPATQPNLMQKFSEMTAPGGDILSKGKELIFMKFGLGGK